MKIDLAELNPVCDCGSAHAYWHGERRGSRTYCDNCWPTHPSNDHQPKNERDLVFYDWDLVPHFSPAWEEIRGKAHMYKTAYRRSDGKIFALLGLITRDADGNLLPQPLFRVREETGLRPMATHQLCGFCL
jgi:hypothetical protein